MLNLKRFHIIERLEHTLFIVINIRIANILQNSKASLQSAHQAAVVRRLVYHELILIDKLFNVV